MAQEGAVAHFCLQTSQGPVQVLVQEGCLGEISRWLGEELASGRLFVVSDTTVAPLYGESLAAAFSAPLLALPAGEGAKNWDSVEQVVRFLLGHGAERGDLLVAVGGGVVTDVVGFAASVYLRGIRWVAVPTTLVGMVDAAIGGKTGIDLPEGKNLLGTFWQPRAVVADPLTLATLPLRQLKAGLAEVLKAALIAPSTLEHNLDEQLLRLLRGDFLAAVPLVAQAARVKGEVVELDERDQGARAALNLGHTLGHALEAATGYNHFLHGEAVAWGLLFALLLAQRRGLLASAEAGKWAARLEKLAPLPPLEVSWEQLLPFLHRDKKRAFGQLRWVLPRLGGVVLGVEVSQEEAREAFQSLQKLPPQGPFAPLYL
jgi:3-dehydroquinate synthase